MATQHDARRIAMALPGMTASTERFAFSVDNKGKAKGFIWARPAAARCTEGPHVGAQGQAGAQDHGRRPSQPRAMTRRRAAT